METMTPFTMDMNHNHNRNKIGNISRRPSNFDKPILHQGLLVC